MSSPQEDVISPIQSSGIPAPSRRPSLFGRKSTFNGAADTKGVGVGSTLRRLSVSLMEANPTPGMWAATGTAIAHAPGLKQLQNADMSENVGFNARGHTTHIIQGPDVDMDDDDKYLKATTVATAVDFNGGAIGNEDKDLDPTNHNPSDEITVPKHTWGRTIRNGLKAAWGFTKTPTGFFIIIYGLNIVAWGAMLFFLLLDAAPAMDYPDANSNDSPRKKWLEIASQILNSLFCVTAFGLAPWRFLDLYHLLRWRWKGQNGGLEFLAKKNASWFRAGTLLDSNSDPATLAPASSPEIGELSAEDSEEERKHLTHTGNIAPPTKTWKLDFVVWMFVWNTLLQVALCYFMWHYNRIDRPSWSTGLFIGLGCGTGMLAGVVTWWEGRRIKKIEGPILEIAKVEEEKKDWQGTQV